MNTPGTTFTETRIPRTTSAIHSSGGSDDGAEVAAGTRSEADGGSGRLMFAREEASPLREPAYLFGAKYPPRLSTTTPSRSDLISTFRQAPSRESFVDV